MRHCKLLHTNPFAPIDEVRLLAFSSERLLAKSVVGDACHDLTRKWNFHDSLGWVVLQVSSSGGGLFGRPENSVEFRGVLYLCRGLPPSQTDQTDESHPSALANFAEVLSDLSG
jgi:hypothetical protein